MKKGYIPRLIDSAIEKELQLFGAVLISGPKWCGKTTTAETHSESSIKLKNKVDDSMHPPSFLAVLTATGPAYTREDGIRVIPLTCLRD